MRYYSTRNRIEGVSFRSAVFDGLAPDGGLFIPEEIPLYSKALVKSLGTMNFCDIAFETIKPYVKDDIPDSALEEIIHASYPFYASLIPVGDRLVLELFHGPTAAFKDFGARFMARAFAWLRRGEDKDLRIITATSGDTGGAVADGFFDIPGISVTVLYPKGRVSPLQEKQIAGLGKNIIAIAVEGSFDDCQNLAKTALADASLKKKMELSSANSINIARLIPQIVYYSAAAGLAFAGKFNLDGEATPRVFGAGDLGHDGGRYMSVLINKGTAAALCVPSGNFGNLTAGLYAMKMGAPVKQFIAATNINKTVPDYLESGKYQTRESKATISNAMDVGAPSNFERMTAHFSYDEMKSVLLGVSVSDDETKETIKKVYREAGYIIDPHTAVGWKGVDKLRAENKVDAAGVLATAHPFKFSEIVEPIIGKIPVPSSLEKAMQRTAKAKTIPVDYSALVELL
jgi:threonine synthase